MAARSWPWDSVAEDRVHGSLHVARALHGLVDDGVVVARGAEMEVVPNSPASMSTFVSLGQAFVQGRYGEVYSEAAEVEHAASDSSNPRIDRVVLRRSMTSREVVPGVVTGTPASSPEPPALTQEPEGDWEIPLARVLVGANVTEITGGDIEDERTIISPVAGRTPEEELAFVTVGVNVTLSATSAAASNEIVTQAGIVLPELSYIRVEAMIPSLRRVQLNVAGPRARVLIRVIAPGPTTTNRIVAEVQAPATNGFAVPVYVTTFFELSAGTYAFSLRGYKLAADNFSADHGGDLDDGFLRVCRIHSPS